MKHENPVDGVIWSKDEKKVLILGSYPEKSSRYLFSLYSNYKNLLMYLKMFDSPPKYREQWVRGKIDTVLTIAFKDNNQSLSDSAIIIKIKPKGWVIMDGSLRYAITDMGTRLDVYQITDMRELIDPYLFRIIGYREEMSEYRDAYIRSQRRVPVQWRSSILSLWNLTTERKIRSIEHENPVDGVIWSKDEERILTWDNSAMKVWKTARGKEIVSFEYYGSIGSELSGITLSKDRKRILAWGGKLALLWDIEKDESQAYQHYSRINGVYWFRGEEKILTWSKDGTARLWNIETGNEIRDFKSRIDCEGMNISKAKGLNEAQYITLLNKGAYMPIGEFRNLNSNLLTQTRINMYMDWDESTTL
jgi:WD40 repeat protein